MNIANVQISNIWLSGWRFVFMCGGDRFCVLLQLNYEEYFQSGTPASALARDTPAAQHASHSTTPKPNTTPMALGREHPIRFCMYCRSCSILWVDPRAIAIRNGRTRAATTYRLAYAAKRLLHCPGASGDRPVCSSNE